MKKISDKDIEQNKIVRKESAEQLSNSIVTLTAVIILYALLLLFLQKMSENTATILGAVAFEQILFWGGIIGAMVCAAIGAYKEKKGFFIYCGIFVYIFWSMTVIQYCGAMGSDKAYLLVYISLAVAFVIVQLYGILVGRGKMYSKRAFTVFSVAAIIIFLLFCAAAVALKTRFFGLWG